MTNHITQQFDAELEAVRTKILKMGGQVEEMIKFALTTRTPWLIKANRNSLATGELVLPAMRRVSNARVTLPRRRNPQPAKVRPTAATKQLRRLSPNR